VFVPDAELSEKGMWEVDWPALEAAEQAYEQALIEKFARFRVIDFSISKIENKLGESFEFKPVDPFGALLRSSGRFRVIDFSLSKIENKLGEDSRPALYR
jgi:hypothetical protein